MEKEKRDRVRRGQGNESDIHSLQAQITEEEIRKERAREIAWKNKPSFASLLKPAVVNVDPLILNLAYIEPVENEGRLGALLVGNQTDRLEKKYKGTIVARRMSIERLDPNYVVQFVKLNWGIRGNEFRIQMRNHGVFFIIFNRQEDYDKVKKAGDTWMGGVYTLIRSWKEGKGIGKDRIENLPIWVSLPKFPKHLWDTTTFSSIGSVLGVPIKVDAHTAKAPNDDGARLLVKMDASGDFPCEVPIFVQEDDSLVVEEIINIHYARPPPKCIRCKLFGHWTNQCFSLQKVAGEGNPSSKEGLEKMDEQCILSPKESYQVAHNFSSNKEKNVVNSGRFEGNKENSSGLGKDKPNELSSLGFVGESLGGNGVMDNLGGKKPTMVGERMDKVIQTNQTNPRVTTKEWVTKANHSSTMDVDPPSPKSGDPHKDPINNNGGSIKDPINIPTRSDKTLSGSKNSLVGSESGSNGSINGSEKDPINNSDSEMEDSSLDPSNKVGHVDTSQPQVSKILGDKAKALGEVSNSPQIVGELSENHGELELAPQRHTKKYSRISRMNSGTFYKGGLRQSNSGISPGADSCTNSNSGTSSGANPRAKSSPTGSSRANSGSRLSSRASSGSRLSSRATPGSRSSSRARSGSRSSSRATPGSRSSSRASSGSRSSSRATPGSRSSSGASTDSSSSSGSSSGSGSRAIIDPVISSSVSSGTKDNPESNYGTMGDSEDNANILTRIDDPVKKKGTTIRSDPVDPTRGKSDPTGQVNGEKENDINIEDPNDNEDPIRGKEWYMEQWNKGTNQDDIMSDAKSWDWDKDENFMVDLSNENIHEHVSQKTWADRWKACAKDMEMGKSMVMVSNAQGVDNINNPPTQLVSMPWNEDNPKGKLTQIRSYGEPETLHRKEKVRATQKEKLKGKPRELPKNENDKYPTIQCEFTQCGNKGKRSPLGQRRGDVKRRKRMAVLVSEALVELERSEGMCT
ncbi:hypothetical protein ZOSMA_1303G00010 [Zostera marina]|uniref:Uncharacterized protein n=1 Tax=Zostera marina TaxID=29655 RepID=A0A0K9PZ29_ZOSMR|nr:hypothetical protein ZOSMA_1303G00010 [Zostera marina]